MPQRTAHKSRIDSSVQKSRTNTICMLYNRTTDRCISWPHGIVVGPPKQPIGAGVESLHMLVQGQVWMQKITPPPVVAYNRNWSAAWPQSGECRLRLIAQVDQRTGIGTVGGGKIGFSIEYGNDSIGCRSVHVRSELGAVARYRASPWKGMRQSNRISPWGAIPKSCASLFGKQRLGLRP